MYLNTNSLTNSFFIARCRYGLIITAGVLTLVSCAVRPLGAFHPDAAPPAPRYSEQEAWAATPFQSDSADIVPDVQFQDRQDSARVDVFYVYPTTYIGNRGEKTWNADVYDTALNEKTDRTAIRNQASVFNGSCRVFAPRYRQGHLECFYTEKCKEDAGKALMLAYTDVRDAFEYYLAHFNHGRPLIIAGHSQGTYHAARLIEEFYTGDPEMPDLITAYLIGMPIPKDQFGTVPPCVAADDVHCFCSWRTVQEKYKPSRYYPVGDEYAVTNPLTWSDDPALVLREAHTGAVLRKFHDGLYSELLDARIDDGLLRVSRPKIPGVPFLPSRNYHIADYNFFYANLRQNIADRIAAYYATHPF